MSVNSTSGTTVNNARDVVSSNHAYEIIDEALDFISIVGKTLGPGGLPIFIERKRLKPLTTKDGVSVAKEMHHPDRKVDTIVQAIKEASIKTNEEAGDGTTSAVVLTHAIFKEGMKLIRSGACTPNELVLSLQSAEKQVVKFMDESTTLICQDKDKIREVAYIACNGDEKIADMVVKAFEAVGEDGVIAVDEGFGREATLRVEEGYEIKKGLDSLGGASRHFMTDIVTQESTLESPKLLFYGGEISDINQLAGALTNIGVEAEGQAVRMPPLAIFAYEWKGPALQMMVMNRVQAGLPIVPIVVPSSGVRSQENTMLDLAVLFGGTAIFPSERHLASVRKEDLGSASRLVCGMKTVRVHGVTGEEEAILKRLETLKTQLEQAEHQYDKDNIKERIGKLVGGIAVIGVGGSTELEMKERKARVEDAIHATRDALETGVVPGGATTFLRAGTSLTGGSFGELVLRRALEWPLRVIVENVGEKSDLISHAILNNQYEAYDARNKRFVESALDSGIVDPLKVVKSAFQNACSIAEELLKAGGVIAFVKQPMLDDPIHNIDE